MEKYVYFNGVKFTRDDKTGYYLNSTIRKRLHRFVWEFYNGEIPDDCQVHHIDEDKSNNDISNLALLPRKEHAKFHSQKNAVKYRDRMIANMNEKARPEAIRWHKSEAGTRWHKKHYDSMKQALYVEKEFVCLQCGTIFRAIDNGQNKFCSNKCKAKHRRDSGVDDETRICEGCGREFKTNKYSKARCCSRACANKNRVYKNKNCCEA